MARSVFSYGYTPATSASRTSPAGRPERVSKMAVEARSAPAWRRCTSLIQVVSGTASIRPSVAGIAAVAIAIGVAAHSRTSSCASAARRKRSGAGSTPARSTCSPRIRVTRHPVPERIRSTCAIASVCAHGLGWMKCTPLSTESAICRWEWPTTTRSGRTGTSASVAATFSGPTPVVS